jgi:hypothetical protein
MGGEEGEIGLARAKEEEDGAAAKADDVPSPR